MGLVSRITSKLGQQVWPGSDLGIALLLFMASNVLVYSVVLIGSGFLPIELPSFSGFCLSDCLWYADLASGGYADGSTDTNLLRYANWAFFPLLPMLARGLVTVLPISAETALILLGKLFLLGNIYAFIKLLRHYHPDVQPQWAGALVALNPFVIYMHAGYTESLYFLLLTLSFIALQRGYWWSGAIGALLSATRVVGVFFALPYLLLAWQRRDKQQWLSRRNLNWLLGLMLIPLGLALFMMFLDQQIGDPLAFKSVQIFWRRTLQNPFSVLIDGFRGFESGYYSLTAVLGMISIMVLIYCRQYALALFMIPALFLPLMTGLTSMPRFVFWQPPFLVALYFVFYRLHRLWPIYFAASGLWIAILALAWFVPSAVFRY
ncbi:hypothetical protein BGP77_10890 [Saccharospirillum sp. MSK14-1]|uniref:hypothetical protein n=1 Tax=Saccharospirillum sp. MSK14-1 TaxID=1897632 RepID=UPI000D38E554|nr:hypothetical protein [Saccharospirillum sp. MSK14-1]PTY38680.1 hypothetical protein BGP77_10890 [Saccharospirillum sp. MSK14-1]